jgi:hypothetical protein
MNIIKRLICMIRGHRYETPAFHANALYFCACCGREMLGRSFADLEPMTETEREEWDACYSGDYQE